MAGDTPWAVMAEVLGIGLRHFTTDGEGTMDNSEVGRLWDENAEAWTALARAGYDVYRDFVNTPAFMAMLPDVAGLQGLDIGCGEGHNTRLLAQRGAGVTALDISTAFIERAVETERNEPAGIRYLRASATELPFPAARFDFVTAFMSIMDVSQADVAIREIHRVLKPAGLFQFSITHPCFQTPQWKWVRNDSNQRIGVICGDYFTAPEVRIEEWIFGAAPVEMRQQLRPFRIPVFQRTLSSWLNLIVKTGFNIESFAEPYADEKTAEQCPAVADTRLIAYFLHMRCRKAR